MAAAAPLFSSLQAPPPPQKTLTLSETLAVERAIKISREGRSEPSLGPEIVVKSLHLRQQSDIK